MCTQRTSHFLPRVLTFHICRVIDMLIYFRRWKWHFPALDLWLLWTVLQANFSRLFSLSQPFSYSLPSLFPCFKSILFDFFFSLLALKIFSFKAFFPHIVFSEEWLVRPFLLWLLIIYSGDSLINYLRWSKCPFNYLLLSYRTWYLSIVTWTPKRQAFHSEMIVLGTILINRRLYVRRLEHHL